MVYGQQGYDEYGPTTGPYGGMLRTVNLAQENQALQGQLDQARNQLAAGGGEGFHGIQFRRGILGSDLNRAMPSVLDRYQNAAGNVLAGSREAESLLRDSYDELFMARAEGIGAEQEELQRSLGSLAQSQGYSQSLVDILGAQAGIRGQAELAGARGQSNVGLSQDLARLVKGTAGEIAGIDQAVAQSLLEAELGQVAADAARDAADKDLLGGILGGGLSLLGGIF